MTSLNDVLLAMSNIPVDDPIAEIWGRGLQGGGYTVREYTGTLPITINTDGQPLLDYLISGNTEQTGTPTPENPIMPSGCGERTGNVMPAGEQKTVVSNGVTFSSDGKGKYTINGTATTDTSAHFNLLSAFTTPISISNGGQGTLSFFNDKECSNVRLVFCKGSTEIDGWGLSQKNRTNTAYNLIGNKYVDSIRITVSVGAPVDVTIMPEFTNDGILPSEFEPYGYKLPILSNSTVTNIYLGEVQTTRRIKKLVLTGTEDWTTVKRPTYTYATSITPFVNSSAVSSHFIQKDFITLANKTFTLFNKNKIYIKYNDTTSVDDFKQFLAAQYAAGTPVTVWYVLAEPETGIVNEPLMKIGNYADTLSMEQADVSIPTNKGTTVIDYDGTPKPSQMYIKYLR